MKTLNNYIIEKFKINSNTVSKVFDEDKVYIIKTIIPDVEINEIKELCPTLPIIPDKISNCIYDKNGKRKSKGSNSRAICLYYFNDNIKVLRISIVKLGGESFYVKFIYKDNNIFDYPQESKTFKSVKECFDCIKENWNKHFD